MTKIKYLSHYLSESTPLYGNGKGIQFSFDKNIEKGDSCNTTQVTFPNHSGTHIDLPFHFDKKGKTLNDYQPSFWQFNKVELIDLSGLVSDCQIIGPEFFTDKINDEAELLLIKTGYQKWRGTDRYTLTPPGISSNLAGFFREKLPNLRCVGMDIISTTSYSNRDEGRKAHHAFLNPSIGSPILLIEDMNLNSSNSFLKVIVAPLLLEKADGAPCTILGYINEN